MTTEVKELVKRLRDTYWSGAPYMRELLDKSADALEAMAGEVEDLKHDIARHMTIANEAAAERDHLKVALQPFSDAYERLVRTQESMGFSDNASFGLGIKVSAIKAARKALGGDAS